MSTDTVRALMKSETAAFRKEVEEHLAKHPIGESYFGMKAARNPRLVGRLRDGAGVTIETMETVRAFMAQRSADLSSAKSSEASDE